MWAGEEKWTAKDSIWVLRGHDDMTRKFKVVLKRRNKENCLEKVKRKIVIVIQFSSACTDHWRKNSFTKTPLPIVFVLFAIEPNISLFNADWQGSSLLSTRPKWRMLRQTRVGWGQSHAGQVQQNGIGQRYKFIRDAGRKELAYAHWNALILAQCGKVFYNEHHKKLFLFCPESQTEGMRLISGT